MEREGGRERESKREAARERGEGASERTVEEVVARSCGHAVPPLEVVGPLV